MRAARLLTLGFGTSATCLALVIGHLGTLVEVTVKIMGLFGGPLLGIFLLGVLVRRANATGAFIGAMAGALVGVAVAFPATFLHTRISCLWIGFSAAVVTFTIGWATSFAAAPPTAEQQTLVYRFGKHRAQQ